MIYFFTFDVDFEDALLKIGFFHFQYQYYTKKMFGLDYIFMEKVLLPFFNIVEYILTLSKFFVSEV